MNLFSKQSWFVLVVALALGSIFSVGIALGSHTGLGVEYFSSWSFFIAGMALSLIIMKNNFKLTATVMLVLIIYLLSVLIIKSQMFNSDEYLKSVTVEDSNMSSFQTEHDNIRKVTLQMAEVLANKVIGVKSNGVQVSSQYVLNTDIASVQEINGVLQWVIPLDYAGFAKWVKQNSVPGYVLVSATNPKAEAKLVLGKKIKATMNGYFMDSIERKIWFANGFKDFDIHMEISDKQEVFWITPIIKPSVGFNIDTVDSVLVMNAETGAKTILSIADTMKKYPWIDRIWPESIIFERIEFYGSLKDGFWNTMFGETNINKPTDYENAELWLVKAGGKLQWFTGMTSVQSDQSLVSAIMVEANSVSVKPVLKEFALTGVTDEKGAVNSIQASLGADSVKWSAVLPQPVIQDGVFYWNTSIVSSSNYIFQKSGVVQGNDISNVFFGETLDDAFNKTNVAVNTVKTSLNSKDEIIAQMIQKIEELDILKEKLKKIK